jgi:hypothetical protein
MYRYLCDAARRVITVGRKDDIPLVALNKVLAMRTFRDKAGVGPHFIDDNVSELNRRCKDLPAIETTYPASGHFCLGTLDWRKQPDTWVDVDFSNPIFGRKTGPRPGRGPRARAASIIA